MRGRSGDQVTLRGQGAAAVPVKPGQGPTPRGQEVVYAINGGPVQADAQVDSTAPDLATLKADFNALLAKLRDARILSS